VLNDRIQILAPVVFTDRKSQKGNTYRAAEVQGILQREDGTQSVFSLLLMAPRGEQGKNLEPGLYVPVPELRVNMQDRMRLGFEIIGFVPAKAVELKKVA
jgi:hypothetical protein